ncbi:F0F1 ATP synthase subunit A [Candidatus Woesebacteria bacterium]|nr:F0F1 ATP synthase subunit A [Candidatus Woesebacteria bacterium]
MSPHISIKGEIVFDVLGFPVTNTVLTTILVVIGFFFIARYYYAQIHKKDRTLGFYALHGFVMMIQTLVSSVLGKRGNFFFPLLGSFFFFILMMNWSGLVPGVGSLLVKVHEHTIPLLRGGTADLNTTLALALITVFVTQIFGFKFLGAKVHLSKYFNFKDPMMLFLGPLEIVQEFARIVSFSFRLYGNIFAGEVLLTIIPFLLPAALSFIVSPIFFLEVFVGVVQALVFVMLSAVFINMATAEHH